MKNASPVGQKYKVDAKFYANVPSYQSRKAGFYYISDSLKNITAVDCYSRPRAKAKL